ncbi:MAG: alanine--tRNA ligase [Clostridiales bacterium]|nr:alanine--tRNA ligase [Clostridiales bacterium]
MEWMSLNDIREKFLSFYESKGCLRHKSFPLVPINDKSLLLINAGMAPLKKYFTGELEPPRHRMTTCQKCIRTPDIERVGITARHGTYFEMLGNFSFGDYFKHEAINWAWEFVTKVLELPEERVWVTIYQDDDQAHDIWMNEAGVPDERIVRLGKEDNFWEIGSGPCGPCSEIYFDRGPEYGCGKPDCKPGCDCDRYMEFWNLVFTQFDGDGKGGYTPLAKPNIDTGMGLERMACIMQGVNNLFETDTVRNIMKKISEIAGIHYGDDPKTDISLRVITDHVRASTFLIADGVVPSNEGRGYVLRRLIRRAARHGRLLGIKGCFLCDVVDTVAHENYPEYSELTENGEYIKKLMKIEEERFADTIDAGLDILSGMIKEAKDAGRDTLSGDEVFKLSDTYGFNIDLTREIAAEQNLSVDDEGYQKLLTEQKERARAARAALGDFSWVGESFEYLKDIAKTEFTGYAETATEGCRVLAIVDSSDNEPVDKIEASDVSETGKAVIVLDRTPFYGEGGGQVGDTGILENDTTKVRVSDTKKHDGVYMMIGTIEKGSLRVGDTVTASVDAARRNAIKRNHSAAHMLQAALRKVLGSHVEQAGSYVDDKEVRFDFSHFQAMTAEEIKAVENEVNAEILKGDPIETVETDIETAKKQGAMALFSEKYGKVVRMVKMGGYSTELCGGTHLDNTAKAGLFRIIGESSVAAGIRRITGVTGFGVIDLLNSRDALIADTAKELKAASPADIAKRASAVMSDVRNANHAIEELNAKLASGQTDEIIGSAKAIGVVRLAAKRLKGVSTDAARALGDSLKAKAPEIVAVLTVENGDKTQIITVCGKSAVQAGAHAGNILKAVAAVTGGKGGGRPDSAMGGAGDASKIGEALDAAADIVSGMLK